MYKILVVDTETGGLDPTKFSILSVAAVVLQDGVVKDEFYRVLKEGNAPGFIQVSEQALKVNGFTVDKILETGTPVAEAMADFIVFLRKNGFTTRTVLAGHNTPFDVGFLKRWFRLVGREDEFDNKFSYRLIDTASIAQFLQMAGLLRNMQSSSLDNIAKEFDLARTSEDHNALEDTKMTAELLVRMIKRVQEVSAI